jgi:copper chaperone CopZ
MNTITQTKKPSPIKRTTLQLILTSILACTTLPEWGVASESPTSGNKTNRFSITGMSCDGCAKGIASELRRVTGVVSVDVSFSNKLAIVICNTNLASTTAITKAISEAGYESKLVKPAKSRPN